jgi:hypothetical protein
LRPPSLFLRIEFSIILTAFDNAFVNDVIIQIKDDNSGLCVGDSPSGAGVAYETKCNNTSYPAMGGGPGTVFILDHSNCPNGYSIYVSRQWSDTNSASTGILMTDVNGDHISLDSKGSGSCLKAA